MSSSQLKLDARQGQNLVLTPQMQQAIKLLQFNALDLADYLNGVMEANPFLEHDRGHAGDDIDSDDWHKDSDTVPEDSFDALTSDGECGEALDISHDNQFDDESPVYDTPSSTAGSDDYDYLNDSAAHKPSLREHINQQLRIAFADNKYVLIGQMLFDNLNERGWLSVSDEELCAELKTVSEADFRHVLETIRTFDPVGIFARNLADCLEMQLAEKNRLDPAMRILLDNLELIAAREYNKLMRLCGVDKEDLREMLEEIRLLTPNPIEDYELQTAQTVVPDIYVRQNTRNHWIIDSNDDTRPAIRANQDYYKNLMNQIQDRTDKKYLQQNWQEAKWMVRALTQRSSTIKRVAEAIVRRQIGFFRDGIDGLKPLVLKDIAQDVQMHESTVSRTCSGKYMATPHGIFEMKYFFTNALNGDADGLSSQAIKKRIKTLIDSEDCHKVHSDDAIVAILQKENIDIARRTVAKYRDLLKIPSSAQRKRDKAALL